MQPDNTKAERKPFIICSYRLGQNTVLGTLETFSWNFFALKNDWSPEWRKAVYPQKWLLLLSRNLTHFREKLLGALWMMTYFLQHCHNSPNFLDVLITLHTSFGRVLAAFNNRSFRWKVFSKVFYLKKEFLYQKRQRQFKGIVTSVGVKVSVLSWGSSSKMLLISMLWVSSKMQAESFSPYSLLLMHHGMSKLQSQR